MHQKKPLLEPEEILSIQHIKENIKYFRRGIKQQFNHNLA
jgi:hypothetical protein